MRMKKNGEDRGMKTLIELEDDITTKTKNYLKEI